MTDWQGGQLSDFRRWLIDAWFDILASGYEKHRRAGTNCEPLEVWGTVISYADKYLDKDCEFRSPEGSVEKVGRFWGVWHREEFTITWRSAFLTHNRWAMLRRTIRRLNRSRCPEHLWHRAKSTTVFTQWSELQRLLDLLVLPGVDFRKQFGTTQEFLQALRFDGSVNDWFMMGEVDRQERHRLRRGVRVRDAAGG